MPGRQQPSPRGTLILRQEGLADCLHVLLAGPLGELVTTVVAGTKGKWRLEEKSEVVRGRCLIQDVHGVRRCVLI